MPIDPSIPLSIRAPAPGPSVLDTYAQIQQLQALKSAGEERRAVAQEKAAGRQREAEIEAAMQAAIEVDPATGRPKINYPKLLAGKVSPAAIFELEKITNETTERLLRIQDLNLSVGQKQAVYNAGAARQIAAADYNPEIAEMVLVGAKKSGALDAAEADQVLADGRPIRRRRWRTCGRSGPPRTRTLWRSAIRGRGCTKFVLMMANTFYPTVPKEAPASGLHASPAKHATARRRSPFPIARVPSPRATPPPIARHSSPLSSTAPLWDQIRRPGVASARVHRLRRRLRSGRRKNLQSKAAIGSLQDA
jgi:hypothetical protein